MQQSCRATGMPRWTLAALSINDRQGNGCRERRRINRRVQRPHSRCVALFL